MITWITSLDTLTRIIWTNYVGKNRWHVFKAVELHNDGSFFFFEPSQWLTTEFLTSAWPFYRKTTPMDEKLAMLLLFCQKQGIDNLDDLPPAANPFARGQHILDYLIARKPGTPARRWLVRETRPPYRVFLVDHATAQEIIDND